MWSEDKAGQDTNQSTLQTFIFLLKKLFLKRADLEVKVSGRSK